MDGTWVGVNSARANDVVGTAVAAGLLDAPLAMGAGGVRRGAVRREVKCGDDGKSRRDFVVERLPADGGGDAQVRRECVCSCAIACARPTRAHARKCRCVARAR